MGGGGRGPGMCNAHPYINIFSLYIIYIYIYVNIFFFWGGSTSSTCEVIFA